MNKELIDWDKILNLCELVRANLHSKSLLQQSKVLYLYGVPRGGLIPAVILSNTLNAYGYPTDVVLDLDVLSELHRDNEPIVILDDIADAGDTFNSLYKRFSNATFATLFLREGCSFSPQIVAERWQGDEWLIFPWECSDADPVRDGTIV